MGSTIVRAAAATFTGGTSELARKKPFQPGGGTDLKGAITSAALGPYGTTALAASGTKIDTPGKTPITPQTIKPGMNQDDIEQAAKDAANKRRREYTNLGRSGTILTGPGGLGGTGSGTAKTLLGL